MKKLMVLVAALFLVAATSGMAMAYTYADEVIYMGPPLPEIAGDPHTRVAPPNPNYAPSMNMNWLNSPPCPPPGNTDPMYPGEPNPNPERLVGAPDGYGVGWGPKGPAWNGTANFIVHTALPFTHDGIVAPYGQEVAWNIGGPDNYNQSDTRESLLAEVGYDLAIYGLGYGFNGPFESHAMTTVRVSEDGEDWITVSTWTGDPSRVGPYFENQDGTWKEGIQFNNGGFGACPRTYMVIDLDHPDIIDPATGENMDLPALTGVYNYVWFEGGDLYNDAAVTNGNANFPEAIGANAVPIPGAVWLLGSGLVGLIGIRRKKG